MSRRHSQDRTLNYDPEADFFEDAGIPIWFATKMPEPWDYYYWHQWQAAWADVTLGVANNVWRKEGAKLYATHRDPFLREDLQDWLLVEAVQAGADFKPDAWHPQPHLQYAAFLYGCLRKKARWHFAEVIGPNHTPRGREARDAYGRGVDSTERLDDMESETGGAVQRYAIYGNPFEAADPVQVLIQMEDLAQQIEDLERDDPPGGYVSRSDVCLMNLCTSPAAGRGLCHTHYNQERRHSLDRGDWEPQAPRAGCEVEDCEAEHYSRGRCRPHYRELRAAEAPECTVEDCDSPQATKGLCTSHYAIQRRRGPDAPLGRVNHSRTGPCKIPDCDAPITAKGLCGPHYRAHRKGRL